MKKPLLKHMGLAISTVMVAPVLPHAYSAEISAVEDTSKTDIPAEVTESGVLVEEAPADSSFVLPESGGAGDTDIDSLFLDQGGETETIDGEEVYILSDFEVSVEQDRGYQSSSALSGVRADSLIKDTPMAISVINDQLIDDLNLDGIGDIAEVLSNVELVDDEDGGTTRRLNIRGILSRGQLFDFFPRGLQQDGYNIGRTELVGGTNSLVLGQAEPGGKSNSGGKRATFGNDRTTLELILGDQRKSLEFEKNMQVSDQLAINLMGVTNEKSTDIKFNEKTFEGATLAATYRPSNNTSLRLHLEAVDFHTRSTPNRIRPNANVFRGLGIPQNTLAPEILDYLPQDLLDYAVDINTTGGRRRFGLGSVEEIRDFLEFIEIQPEDYGQVVGKDPDNHTWGGIAIVGMTHSFNDNVQGKLEFFHETSRNKQLRTASDGIVRLGDGGNPNGNIIGRDFTIEQTWSTRKEEEIRNGIRGTLSFTKEFEKSKHQLLVGLDLDQEKTDSYREQLVDEASLPAGFMPGDEFGNNARTTNTFILGTYDTFRAPAGSFAPGSSAVGFPGGPGTTFVPLQSEEIESYYAAAWFALSSRAFNGRLNTLMGFRGSYSVNEVTESINFRTGEGSEPTKAIVRAPSPSLGGVFWLTRNVGLVGSWSKSIQSQDGTFQDPTGANLPAEIGEGRELGFRFEFDEPRLSAEVLYFYIIKENERSQRSAIPDSYLLETYPTAYDDANMNGVIDDGEYIGGVLNFRVPGTTLRSNGVDFKLNYNPSRNLSLRLNYTYLVAENIESPGDTFTGTLQSGLSKNKATFTARYRFSDGPLDGAYVGVNQKYRSGVLLDTIFEDLDSDGREDNLPLPSGEVPERYEIWLDDEFQTELFFGWNGQLPWAQGRSEPRYALQFNIKNLFDNTDFTKAGAFLNGRTFSVKATARF